MKTIAIGSFFVLFAIVVGMTSAPAFADHATATVSAPPGSSVPGCEDTNECYIPYEVTIDVGGEVTWTNDDTAAHTVTSGSPADGPDGLFDSSLFMAGASYSVKFDDYEPGSYNYFCMVHPWMEGIVTVQAAGAEDEMHMEGDMHMEDEMHMEGDATAMGMTGDGSIMVSLWTSVPTEGERMEITMKFTDTDGHGLEHVNHDIMVTQNGAEVLMDEDAHHHEGTGVHETAPLASSDPVDIEITFQGLGMGEIDTRTGPIGEKIVFTNVVPEFGTIAMLILAVAIISIIAVSAKTRVIPRL